MPITNPPLSDREAVVMHLVLVWRTAEEALTQLGRPTNTSNMHVMFEETAKLMRPSAPRLTPKKMSDIEQLKANWQIAEEALKAVDRKPTGANMHVMVEETRKVQQYGTQADHQRV